MNSKEVAQLFELPIDTIRYYERVGVIPPVQRDKNGYRNYTKKDLNWIFLAKSLRKAGLSIESLIEFATLAQSKDNVRGAQKQILARPVSRNRNETGGNESGQGPFAI